MVLYVASFRLFCGFFQQRALWLFSEGTAASGCLVRASTVEHLFFLTAFSHRQKPSQGVRDRNTPISAAPPTAQGKTAVDEPPCQCSTQVCMSIHSFIRSFVRSFIQSDIHEFNMLLN